MKKTNTFEQSLTRLNEIVKLLETNSIDLEESIKLFEEGLQLSQTCQTTLEEYKERIQTLLDQNNLGEDHETNL